MLTRNKIHIRITDAAVSVSAKVAQFDERMSPVDRIERMSHELFEPGLVEEVYRLLVLIPFHVYDFERAVSYTHLLPGLLSCRGVCTP